MAKHTIKYETKFGETLLGYAWTCKEPKANIILVTGMQETAARYDDFATFLNKNNFDVYCIDHYGQGLNIKPDEPMGIWPKSGFSQSVKNIGGLEKQLEKTGLPTYVFGHSMGSFMVQDYIERFHQRVSKVIICGSGYAKPSLMKFAYFISKIKVPSKSYQYPSPSMQKLVTGSLAKAIKNPRTPFDWLSYNEKNVDAYIADPLCGFTATGGFYREFLKGMKRICASKFLKKIQKDIHILIIGGQEDPLSKNGKDIIKLANLYSKKLGVEDVELKIYPQMRHEILNENDHQIVYDDIVSFLNK